MEGVFTVEELYPGATLCICLLHKEQRCEGMDFLTGLQKPDEKKVRRLLLRIAEYGPPRNTEKWRELKGEVNLCEIKSHQVRLFCFFDEHRKRLIITHGCFKQQDEADPQEIKHARDLRDAYLREQRRGHDERPRMV